jgi:HAE1 family hydrophobic/amphiphilic exporter-1
LTTVTTVAGLAPKAYGVGGYSKVWSPFAMSMCWGLTCATLMTLLVIPALYLVVEDVRIYLRRMFGMSETRHEDESGTPSGTPDKPAIMTD